VRQLSGDRSQRVAPLNASDAASSGINDEPAEAGHVDAARRAAGRRVARRKGARCGRRCAAKEERAVRSLSSGEGRGSSPRSQRYFPNSRRTTSGRPGARPKYRQRRCLRTARRWHAPSSYSDQRKAAGWNLSISPFVERKLLVLLRCDSGFGIGRASARNAAWPTAPGRGCDQVAALRAEGRPWRDIGRALWRRGCDGQGGFPAACEKPIGIDCRI
jgi:hypothetical protein